MKSDYFPKINILCIKVEKIWEEIFKVHIPSTIVYRMNLNNY